MEMYYDTKSAELFKGANKLLESRTKVTNEKNEFEQFTIQEIQDLMMYCIQREYPRQPGDENFSKIHPGFNIEASSAEESYVLDRVLNRIKSINVLQYPMMQSDLRFQRVDMGGKESG